jgi:hypothetical protein
MIDYVSPSRRQPLNEDASCGIADAKPDDHWTSCRASGAFSEDFIFCNDDCATLSGVVPDRDVISVAQAEIVDMLGCIPPLELASSPTLVAIERR